MELDARYVTVAADSTAAQVFGSWDSDLGDCGVTWLEGNYAKLRVQRISWQVIDWAVIYGGWTLDCKVENLRYVQ